MRPCQKGRRGDNEGVCMDGEEEPHEYLRYIIEGKKNCCITQEHAEDSF